MDEQEYKNCLKIHGYVSSEEESDSESKPQLDEIYKRYKPPPIQIDVEKHHIIVIGLDRKDGNEGLSKSQRKRKRKKKKETGGNNTFEIDESTDNTDNSIATDKMICDNFDHIAAASTSCNSTRNKLKLGEKTTKISLISSGQGNNTKKAKDKKAYISTNTKLTGTDKKLEAENKVTKSSLLLPSRHETTTKNSEANNISISTNHKLCDDVMEVYPFCRVEQTYADALKSTKVRKVNIPDSRLVNHVQNLFSTEDLTKKEKQILRKKIWKTYRRSTSFGDISQQFWDQEKQRSLTFGDFINVESTF